jgi:hypothetical protein
MCCVDTRNEETFDWIKSVYSMMIIVKNISFLYLRVTGKWEGEKERTREKEESVRDRVWS